MSGGTIQVFYKDLGFDVHHKYIIYTDTNGTRYVARGKAGISDNELGSVETSHGVYNDGHPDWDIDTPDPFETIYEGPDASDYWSDITDAMDDIMSENYIYGGAAQNCNSVVDEALDRAGLTSPQLDDPGENFAPGSGVPLSVPAFLDDIVQPIADFLAPILAALPFAAGQSSPLVLDLEGDGIELAALNGEGSVYWNIDNDDFAEASGWIAGGDGLLCIDLNEDGIINNQSELFGNTSTYANGFAALDAYDTNNDNYITSADTQFGDLLVWIDSNADGHSQEAELHTLTDLGITSIATTYSNVNYTISGNDIKQTGTFTINGNTRTIVDAWFSYDDVNTQYSNTVEFNELVFYMPSLRGYGNIPDLHIAMSQDETLLGMVQEIASTDSATLFSAAFDFQAKIEAILYRWAGVDDVSPTSRGSYIDARQLEFLEELSGKEWTGNGTGSNPGTNQADTLKAAFHDAFNHFASSLLAQTGALDSALGSSTYNLAADTLSEGDLNFIFGTNGMNTIHGTSGSDIFIAKGDTDSIYGYAGDDVYIYNSGDGWDKIYESSGNDILKFGSDILVDDFRLVRANSSIVDIDVYIGSTKIATLMNQAYDIQNNTNIYDEVETALFADNSAINLTSNLTFTGTSSGQNIYGLNDNNTMIGKGGNDALYGYSGNDTYVYNLGDGADTIIDSAGTDVLKFGAGITANDIRFYRGNSGMTDLDIYIGGTKIVTLQDQNYDVQNGTNNYDEVETALFADNSTLDLVNNLTFTGTSSGQTMYGLNDNNIMKGLEGNDSLYGYNGNDTLFGGSGTDNLYGGNGLDTFMFEATTAFSGIDDIKDFSLAQSDKIDISDLLDGYYNPLTEAITDFIQITTSGSNSIVKIDQNGLDGGVNFVQIAQITGVTGLTDEQALVNSGNLVVV
jgi:Ca2+-binding RTX toxin-like protein